MLTESIIESNELLSHNIPAMRAHFDRQRYLVQGPHNLTPPEADTPRRMDLNPSFASLFPAENAT